MNYEEACEATVSRARALDEVKRHGCDTAEFLADVGDRATYRGAEVLNWLGY
ncbi:hypothetical protein [Variovorax sp. 160MFSha2.1]|uniref:hypothetical protein n=1 Tax=Variovorax sp. 160MFSha2.1 TaxID=3158367 RepID=UPI003AADAD3F